MVQWWPVAQRQEDAWELALDYWALLQEATNAHATELVWAFLVTLGALSVWLWRVMGLQEAERYHDCMVTSRPVFARTLSPTSLQSSYFSSIYKNRTAARDRNTTDSRTNIPPYAAQLCNQEEMPYKYGSVPRGIWRYPDVKSEDERLAQGDRPSEQCDTKVAYWSTLGIAVPVLPVPGPTSSSCLPYPTPRPRSRSPLKGKSQQPHIVSDYQRPCHDSRHPSHLLSSGDDSSFVDAVARPSRNRLHTNRQDQSPRPQDGQGLGDAEAGCTSLACRASTGRQEGGWNRRRKSRQYWKEMGEASDSEHSVGKSFKQETEKNQGSSDAVVLEQGCGADKTLPQRGGKLLPQNPRHSKSIASRASFHSAKSNIVASESTRSQGEEDVNKDRSKYRKYQMTDEAEQELVERLKKKFFTPRRDRQGSTKSFTHANSKTSLHTPTLGAQQHNKHHQEPDLSQPQSLDVKLVPADARGAAPDADKEVDTKARAHEEHKLRAKRYPRVQADSSQWIERQNRNSRPLVDEKTMQDGFTEIFTELPTEHSGFPSTIPAKNYSSENKREDEANEAGFDNTHEKGKHLARLKRRLQNSLEYLKEEQIDMVMEKAVPSGVLETKAIVEPLALTSALQRDPGLPKEKFPGFDGLGVAKTSQSKGEQIGVNTPPPKGEYESASKTVCVNNKLSALEIDTRAQFRLKAGTKSCETVLSRLSLHSTKGTVQPTDLNVAVSASFGSKQGGQRQQYNKYSGQEEQSYPLEMCDTQNQGNNESTQTVAPADDKGHTQNQHLLYHTSRTSAEGLENGKTTSSSIDRSLANIERYEAQMEGQYKRTKQGKEVGELTRNVGPKSVSEVDHKLHTKDSDVLREYKNFEDKGVSTELCMTEKCPSAQENQLKNDDPKNIASLGVPKTKEHVLASRKNVLNIAVMSESPHSKATHFQANDMQNFSELSTNTLFLSRRNLYFLRQQELEDSKKTSNATPCVEIEDKQAEDAADGTTSPVHISRGVANEGELVLRRRVRWRRLAEKQHMEGLTLKIPPPVPPKTCHPMDSSSRPLTPSSVSPFPQSNQPPEPVDNVLIADQTVTEGTEKSENEKYCIGLEQPTSNAKNAKPPKPPKPLMWSNPDKEENVNIIKDKNAAGETGEMKEAERSQVCEEKSLSPKQAASIFEPQLRQTVERKVAEPPKRMEWVSEADGNDGGTSKKASRTRFQETLQNFQSNIQKSDKPPSP